MFAVVGLESEAEIGSFSGARPTSLARFELSLHDCQFPEVDSYESTLFSRWDPAAGRRCFLQKRREFTCSP